jgi:hypothetical protein
VIVPSHDLTSIALLALGGSLPVVLAGALIIKLARSWSITVSMVALVLIPTLADSCPTCPSGRSPSCCWS